MKHGLKRKKKRYIPDLTEILCAIILPPITARVVHIPCPIMAPKVTPTAS